MCSGTVVAYLCALFLRQAYELELDHWEVKGIWSEEHKMKICGRNINTWEWKRKHQFWKSGKAIDESVWEKSATNWGHKVGQSFLQARLTCHRTCYRSMKFVFSLESSLQVLKLWVKAIKCCEVLLCFAFPG